MVYVDALATQISVRTGYVGVENLEISEQVHADIAEEFKRLEPSPMGVASQKQKRPLDTPTLKATAKKQLYKTAGDKAEASESKGAPSPGSEIVSASLESDRDAPEDMKGRQKTLSPTLSESKSFVIYPKSELTIHAGSIGALGEVISFLDENQPVSVDIRAYTDSSGNFERNLALSQKRVSEIRNYLILHDIPDEIITAQILDETTFLENNRNKVQSPLPHRVEITIR